MALVNLPGGVWIPGYGMQSAVPPALSSRLCNASGNKVAAIFRCPKAGTLDLFEFRMAVVTTFPTNGLRVSFQDVNMTDGSADGTQDQFRDITSNPGGSTWVATGLITSDGTDGGGKRSVAAGDLVAVVIEQVNSADTWNLNISSSNVATSTACLTVSNECYVNHFTGGAWSLDKAPICALKYSDGTYARILGGCVPAMAFNAPAFNNGSSPDERALLFSLPVRCKIDAAWCIADLDGNCDLVVYDSAGSEWDVIAMDPNVRLVSNARLFFLPFDELTLQPNVDYRISLRPSSGTSITGYNFDVNSAGLLDAVEGGQNFRSSTRVNAGSWTDVTTTRPFMGVRLSAIDDGNNLVISQPRRVR